MKFGVGKQICICIFFILTFLSGCRPYLLESGAGAGTGGLAASSDPLVPSTIAPGTIPFVETFEPSTHPLIPVSPALPYSPRWRAGIGVSFFGPLAFNWPEHRPGWYLSWSINIAENEFDAYESAPMVRMAPPDDVELGMEFVPLVGVFRGNLHHTPALLTATAALNPGKTWLIGNEPDVLWQSNTTPEDYAHVFHQAAAAIRAGDPTARIAIGGLSQITPLRLLYLERVWESYLALYGEPIPVDIWTMHAFILREEGGNWGVGIPIGLGDIASGELWEIEDHDDLSLVEMQVWKMRQWMADHGQRDKPLWVTEYGILMPEELGFTSDVVVNFMLASFDLFSTLKDPNLGYPADDNLMVQRWLWFSTYYEPYPTGNAFTDKGLPTPIMDAYATWIEEQSIPQN